jgi:hypothetical protein
MSVEVVTDASRKLIRATANSETTLVELMTLFAKLVDSPDFQPGTKVLLDMTEYPHQASAADIRLIADNIVAHAQVSPGSEIAAVVSQAVSYGMLRMLQALIEGYPFHLYVCYDREEAERHLGILSPVPLEDRPEAEDPSGLAAF